MDVVFDFGGVVFRWEPERFLPRLLPQRATSAEATRALIGDFFEGFGGDWGEFDRGALDADELVPRIAARTGLSGAEVERVVAAIPDELQAVPETVALIERLRERGHRLHYLSNMPAPYARRLQADNPLDEWFEGGVYSSSVGLVKPEPAIYAEVAGRYGIEPSDAVFIDDSPPNVEAARGIGWRALRFTSPAQCEAELRELGLV